MRCVCARRVFAFLGLTATADLTLHAPQWLLAVEQVIKAAASAAAFSARAGRRLFASHYEWSMQNRLLLNRQLIIPVQQSNALGVPS